MNAASGERSMGLNPGKGAIEFELLNGVGHVEDDDALMRAMQPHSCGRDLSPTRLYMRRMESTAARIRAWIKATLKETGMSAREWSRRAGVAPSTLQRALKDDYEFTTSNKTLQKLADAAGVTVPLSLELTHGQVVPSMLPIRYECGAGVWQEVTDMQAFIGSAPVSIDMAFDGFPQWLERVVGDSMDREYMPGDIVHVVDAQAIGYAPRHNDHVVIVRRRHQGREMERTVKAVVRTKHGFEFWPRSTNLRWDKPIVLTDGVDADDCEVEISGLVLGSYRPRR